LERNKLRFINKR